MDYITYSKRLEYLQELIDKKRIKSPKDICIKFNCCEKTARNMINALRLMGTNVKYCRKNKIYYIHNV